LKKIQPHAQFILFTMRSGEELNQAADWCRKNGIKLFGVNLNPGQGAWTSSPKAYAHVYVDDSGICIPLLPGTAGIRRMVDWSKVGPDLLGRAIAHQNETGNLSLHITFKRNPKILPSHPSRDRDADGSWVFSDASAGLVDEPFVNGADTLIEAVAETKGFLEEAKEAGVVAVFSGEQFSNADVCLIRDKEENLFGNWYTESKTKHRAWLCPALYKYFHTAPKQLWIRIQPV
jgi:hypothetical protein